MKELRGYRQVGISTHIYEDGSTMVEYRGERYRVPSDKIKIRMTMGMFGDGYLEYYIYWRYLK